MSLVPSSGVRKARPSRIEAIDLARGIAVALMILSHGVKGLLTFEQFPSWGLVPIHLMTKFSSSLFVLVFGISLSAAFLPAVGTSAWPAKRRKLLARGLLVLFWYKVLTIVEMSHLHEPAEIRDALLYREFPVYVEILGFYAIALLWVPFVLPLWKRISQTLRALSPALLLATAFLAAHHFDFWGSPSLRALFVEHEDHYTWGQLTRGPLILLGLLVGEGVRRSYPHPQARRRFAAFLAACCGILFLLFFAQAERNLGEQLVGIAKNLGKHPPDLPFMLFSLGGAFGLLSLVQLGGDRLASLFRPLAWIGKDALQAFVFHIFVLFVGLRFLMGYFHTISYPTALGLAVCLVAFTAIWVKIYRWFQSNS